MHCQWESYDGTWRSQVSSHLSNQRQWSHWAAMMHAHTGERGKTACTIWNVISHHCVTKTARSKVPFFVVFLRQLINSMLLLRITRTKAFYSSFSVAVQPHWHNYSCPFSFPAIDWHNTKTYIYEASIQDEPISLPRLPFIGISTQGKKKKKESSRFGLGVTQYRACVRACVITDQYPIEPFWIEL